MFDVTHREKEPVCILLWEEAEIMRIEDGVRIYRLITMYNSQLYTHKIC